MSQAQAVFDSELNMQSQQERVKPGKWSLNNGLVQVLVISVMAFCCPGMFNALSGLGGAGSSDVTVTSLSNAVLYLTFVVFGYSGGTFFNLLGPKIIAPIGASTYAIYAIFSYLSGNGQDWSSAMFILSGALVGFGAGWFWTSQGAMVMAYAPETRKATYITIFWLIFNLGGFLGGILTFSINFNSGTGSSGTAANPASYFVFVAIMGLGTVLGALLILQPRNVVMEDGTKVIVPPQDSFQVELKRVVAVVTDRNMIMLIPLFFATNFFYTYVFNSQVGLFSIRTRGLNSALFWGSQMIGAVTFGRIVNFRQPHGVRNQGIWAIGSVIVLQAIGWVLGGVLQYNYNGGFVNGTFPDGQLIDIKDSSYGYIAIVYIFYGLADSIIQTFAYWLMSTIGGADAALCARYSGFYKGVQSLGAAVAWILGSSFIQASFPLQYWLCVGLFVAGMIGAAPVVNKLGAVDEEIKGDEEPEVNI